MKEDGRETRLRRRHVQQWAGDEALSEKPEMFGVLLRRWAQSAVFYYSNPFVFTISDS